MPATHPDRAPDPRRRAIFSFLTTLAWAMVFGLMYLALRLPYFAQAKASYGLVAAPLLAVFFAESIGRCDAWLAARGRVAARAVLHGWFFALVAVLFLSFAA